MLNFRRFFEKIIGHSFNVSRDREKLIYLRDKEFVRYVVFFKRSWFFGLFQIWIPILSLIILYFNILLLWKKFPTTIAIISIIIVSLSVLFAVFGFLNYLLKYRKIYNNQYVIENINKTIKKVEIGNEAFTKFFNQGWFNKMLFILFIVILTIYIFFSEGSYSFISAGNIILFILQYILITHSIAVLQNLEMDFWIGTRKLDDTDGKVKGVFIHVDQEGFKLETDKDYFADQIKTIEAEFSKILGILLNFGKLIIDTEGAGSSSQLVISYLKSPVELKDSLKKIIKESIRSYEKNNNYYLDYMIINSGYRPKNMLLFEEGVVIGIKDEYKETIREMLTEYQEFLQYQYEKNDLDAFVKLHISNIYKWIQ